MVGLVDTIVQIGYNDPTVSQSPGERLVCMSVQHPTVDELCESLRGLPEDQLDQVMGFLRDLARDREEDALSGVAPLYRVHTAAVRTGIPDLADQHDHYLYGLAKRNA
jgi:hypothetical protein